MADTLDSKQFISSTIGVSGAYVWRAPVGTALPTDFTQKMSEVSGFVNLGEIGEDGFTEGVDLSVENILNMNQEVVGTLQSSATETCTFTLLDQAAHAFNVIYGSKNVVSEGGITTVSHDWTKSDETYAYVFDLLLKDNRKWRKVIPAAKVTELGEFTGSGASPAGREVTLTYLEPAYDILEDAPGSADTDVDTES